MCDKTCDCQTTDTPRKFKVGNIVRFIKVKDVASAAKEGSVALVLGYRNDFPQPHQTVGFPAKENYLEVFWLDSLSGSQSNGGYHEADFELMYESFKNYRPDIKIEDRGLVSEGSYGANKALQSLAEHVEWVRGTGREVDCTVTETKIVTETVRNTTRL